MKKITNIILSLLFPTILLAQTTIQGAVVDVQGNSFPYASVIVWKYDKSVAASALCNESGKFIIQKELPNGTYTATASYLNNESQPYTLVISDSEQSFSFTLTISSFSVNLDSVSIVGHRNTIKQFADKIEVTPSNDIVNNGNSALDILENSPVITINKSHGTISLLGQNATIQINGRDSHMSASDCITYLESLDANTISKIQIISSPSSDYDATGTGGIINFVLATATAEGFKGKLTSNFTRRTRYSWKEAVAIYYTKQKFSMSADASYLNAKRNIYRTNNQYNNSFNYETKQEQDMRSTPISLNANGTYKANERNSFGTSLRYYKGETNDYVNSKSDIIHLGIIDSSFLENAHLQYPHSKTGVNIFYDHTFKKNAKLKTDVDFFNYTDEQNTDFDGVASDTIQYRSWQLNNPTDTKTNIGATKIDFSILLRDSSNFECGAKTSFSGTKYHNLYKINNGTNDKSDSTTYHFNENIFAAYTSWEKLFFHKFNLKTGIRAEYAISNGENQDTTILDTKRLDIFPTFFAMYPISEKHLIKFSYNRRVNRPSYTYTNPFKKYDTPLTQFMGNPFLKNTYNNRMEITYIYKYNWWVTTFSDHISNIMDQHAENSENQNTILYTFDNIGNMIQFGTYLGGYKQVLPYWGMNIQLGGFYYKTYYEGQKTYNDFHYNGQILNQFYLPYNIKFECSFAYESAVMYGLFKSEPMYSLNFAMAKPFGKKQNIIVVLKFDDVFKSYTNKGNADYSTFSVYDEYNFDTRRLFLGLTWNFGNTQLKEKNRQNSTIEDEERRATETRK